MRVLLVDDRKSLIDSLARSISACFPEAEVFSTQSANEALELCHEKEFDKCLIDFRLIDDDGVSLAFKIKKILPGAKLAILSAYPEPADIIVKPYEVWIVKSYDLSPIIEFLSAGNPHCLKP